MITELINQTNFKLESIIFEFQLQNMIFSTTSGGAATTDPTAQAFTAPTAVV